MEISIFGLGYVGSVSAACLANEGHNIIGVDKNDEKIKMINNGEPTIIEPHLKDLTLAAVRKNNLRATQDARLAILSSDFSYICVGTPSNPNNSINLAYIENVCKEIGMALKEKSSYHTIACRSTMFPGSIKSVVIPTLEKYSGKKCGTHFSVCINPEFMKEGTAVYDFYHPSQNIVGASDPIGKNVLKTLNFSYTNMDTTFMAIEQAEFLKYSYNIWHALKVCYANEIGNVCKKLGIDSHAIMDVFCQDKKLNLSSYYLKPGFAFGGSCLPKDLRAFLYETKNLEIELPVIDSVISSNNLQIEHAYNLITAQGNTDIGILGFSFKDDTDDIRESPMIELIERLLKKGYKLSLFDKNVSEALARGINHDYYINHLSHIHKLVVPNVDEVLENAKTIVVGTKAKEFSTIINQLRHDHVIIDLVRIIDPLLTSPQYKGICW